MKKLLAIVVLGLLLSSNAYTHPSKKHKPLVCIPESERTSDQLEDQKTQNFFHRLTKQQQDCLLLRVEELEKENKELKDKLN